MKYITLLLCAVLYAISLTTYGQEIYVANDQQITKRIPPNEESGILIDNPIKVGEEVHIPYQNSQLHHVESHMVIHPSNPDHWLVTAMIITDPVAWNIEAAVWLTVDAGKNWSRKDFPKIFADPYLSIDDDGIVYFSGLGQSTKGDNNEYYYISKDGGKRWSNGQPVEGPHDHPFLITKGKDTFWWSTMKGNRQLNIRKAHKGEVFQSLKTIHFNDSFRHDNMIPALLGNDTLILPFIKYHSSYTGIDVEGAYFFTTTDGINIQGPERITNRTGSAKGLESMLVDNSESKYKGNLYFLYPLGDMRKSEGLELSISSDGGKLWREVTFRKPERGKRYYVPTGAINKNGVLGIYWYEHSESEPFIDNDIFFTVSKDGGKTFIEPVKVNKVTSKLPRTGKDVRVSRTFPGGGHYSGMKVLPDGSFQMVWSDARSGTYQLYTSNITIQ